MGASHQAALPLLLACCCALLSPCMCSEADGPHCGRQLLQGEAQSLEVAKVKAAQSQTGARSRVPTGLQDALAQAVLSTQVDAHNYREVARTLAANLVPWQGQEYIAAPKSWAGKVPAWPPVDEGEGGTPVPAALSISAAKAKEAQPVPEKVDRSHPASSHCCGLLDSIGFRSNLPVIVVDTGGSVVIPVRTNMRASICTCGAAFAARGDGQAEDLQGYMNVKIRGSSSAVQNVKKQLGIKLRWTKEEDMYQGRRKLAQDSEEQGEEQEEEDEDDVEAASGASSLPKLGKKREASLVGMPPGSHFVLWGGDGDTTLGMRNALAYDTARATDNWAPRVQYAELFVIQDGRPLSIDHYTGFTLVMERIKRDKHRVDVQKLKPEEDLSGGYIWGYERNLWDDLRFSPTPQRGDGRGLTYLIDYPKMKEAIKDQQQGKLSGTPLKIVTWCASFMASAEAALVLDQPPKDSAATTGMGAWRALVNETAMIDYLLATEVTKNPDGFRGSIYMSKDKGKPLHIGPVWDYNEAFGMCCGYPITGYQNQGISNGTSGGSAISPEGFRFNICDEPARCVDDKADGISLWFRATWRREAAFRRNVALRWKQLRSEKLSDEWFKGRLRTYSQELSLAAPRHFIRWAAVHESPYYESPFDLYKWSVRTMGEWLFPHLAWLDAAFHDALTEAQEEGSEGGPESFPVDQAVMDAAVAAADAEAAAAEAGALRIAVRPGSDAPVTVEPYSISERIAELRKSLG